MADYVNGVYMKEKDGKYGKYFVLSFKEDGLKNLMQIEPNQDGFRTIIASPRKDDPSKFSLKPFIKKDDLPF
jgi:hypothetical protein